MADLADFEHLQPTTPLLGGAIGTTVILSQSGAGITTLTGVTIDDANGNALGDGSLIFNFTNTTLTWTPPSGSVGTAVDVSADGGYAIQGANDGGLLEVTIVASLLPGANTTNTITIGRQSNKVQDNVTKDESDVGMTDYRLVYLKNNSADTKKEVKIWIGTNTPGEDTISIGLDPAGVNATGATVADENTAPAGVTFTAPAVVADALSMGTLTSGQYYGYWIKRLVPSSVTTEYLNDNWHISISAKV